MRKILLLAVAAMMATMDVCGQIPANILEVLKKCDEKMDDPAGLIVDMMVKTKVMLIPVKGTMKMYSKGEKSFSEVVIKAMGQEMREESGFDGQQSWEFTTAMGKKERDSLIITKTTQAKKSDYNVDFDFDKMYKSAKMKEKGLYYVIDLSDRIDPEAPKKMTVKVAKDTYYLREITMPAKMANLTMTVTKVTRGCNDSYFKLDMNRYKNAVVVRK